MITNSKDSDKTILKIVEDYISPPQHPITVQNIQKIIYDNTKISINRRKVKEILKNKLNYTYKKGSFGSSWLKSKSSKIQKSIFSSQVFCDIYTNKLIVNIDESSF